MNVHERCSYVDPNLWSFMNTLIFWPIYKWCSWTCSYLKLICEQCSWSNSYFDWHMNDDHEHGHIWTDLWTMLMNVLIFRPVCERCSWKGSCVNRSVDDIYEHTENMWKQTYPFLKFEKITHFRSSQCWIRHWEKINSLPFFDAKQHLCPLNCK